MTQKDRIKKRLSLYGMELNKWRAVKKLAWYNSRMHAIAEDDCNGNPMLDMKLLREKGIRSHIQDVERARSNKKKWDRYVRKVWELAGEHNFEVRIQGDPRGSIIKLDLRNTGSTEYMGTDTDIINK